MKNEFENKEELYKEQKQNFVEEKEENDIKENVGENSKHNNSKYNKHKGILGELFEWVVMLVIAAGIAFFVNNVLITNSYIPTGSMESTLPVGARVFGSRLSYIFSPVKRGDIVVIDFGYICKNKDCQNMYQKLDKTRPELLSPYLNISTVSDLNKIYTDFCPSCGRKNSQNKKAYYIKRCIGIPGDKIEIKYDYDAPISDFHETKIRGEGTVKAGHVYVNGVKQEEPYINEPMIVDGKFYKEYNIIVPDNAYFLLGDNRNNSLDARFWEQMFVSKEQIIGKASFMYWPINRMGIVH